MEKNLGKDIGDNRDSEMQKIMTDYHNSVDIEIYDFVNMVMHNIDVHPVTVGYLSSDKMEKVKKCLSVVKEMEFAPRVVMDADAMRHMLKMHGKDGKHDHSLGDIRDIARMSYVLANFDDVSFDGEYSKKYRCADNTNAPHVAFRKQIDGTYYLIVAVSDGKKGVSHIVTAFIN